MSIHRYLHRFIICGLYAAVFMPLFFINNLIFPFITSKIFIFQILVELMAGAYLLLIYLDSSFRPKRSVILYSLSIFIFSMLLSAFLGVDIRRSFWSNYERLSGIFNVLHFFIFFLILSGILRTKEAWTKYLSFVFAVSFLEVGISIAQYFSKNLFFVAGGGRIWGTLGNFIYISTYAIFHIFLGLFLIFIIKSRFLKWLIGLGIFAHLITLYLSGTRGGYLGLIFGVLVFLGTLLGVSQSKKTRLVSALGFVCLIAVGLFTFYFGAKPFLRKIPVIGPAMSSLSQTSLKSGTGFTRLINWGIAIQGWKDRPLLGWGPENYIYILNKHYDSKLFEYGGLKETWPDKPHNVALEVLATQGLIGFIIYLAIFLSIIFVLIKSWRRNELSASALAALAGGLGAYFTQNLFVFDHPSSLLLFYIFLAWFHSLKVNELQSSQALNNEARRSRAVAKENKKVKELDNPQKHQYTVLIITATFLSVFILIVWGTINPWRSALRVVRAVGKSFNDLDGAYKIFEQALKIKNPYKSDVQIIFGKVIHKEMRATVDFATSQEAKIKFFIKELEDYLHKHPLDVQAQLILGRGYAVLALTDKTYDALAEQIMARATELSPARQQVYIDWAMNKLSQNKFDEARQLITRAKNINPNVSEVYWFLGVVEVKAGNKQDALDYFLEAKKRNYKWTSPGELLFVANLLKYLKRESEAPEIIDEANQIKQRHK